MCRGAGLRSLCREYAGFLVEFVRCVLQLCCGFILLQRRIFGDSVVFQLQLILVGFAQGRIGLDLALRGLCHAGIHVGNSVCRIVGNRRRIYFIRRIGFCQKPDGFLLLRQGFIFFFFGIAQPAQPRGTRRISIRLVPDFLSLFEINGRLVSQQVGLCDVIACFGSTELLKLVECPGIVVEGILVVVLLDDRSL